jgi:hypothetical protein
MDVFQKHSYEVNYCGAYACRMITGGSVYSPHAWGLAMDINPGKNPYNKRGLITNIPMVVIEDVYRIRTADSDQRVFKWGGDWDGDWDFDEHTVWDAMHFEVIATPEEILEGIVFRGDLPVEVMPNMFTQYGAKGPVVEYWQRVILEVDPSLLPGYGPDGDYGDETAAGVASIIGGDGMQVGPAESVALGNAWHDGGWDDDEDDAVRAHLVAQARDTIGEFG